MSDFLDQIPTRLLAERDTEHLRDWLRHRGLTLSLYDLDAERRRRGITIIRPISATARNRKAAS